MLREAHTDEGQWLEKQKNVLTLQMFRAGARMPTI
jgi:hypothetical protein